MITTAVCCPSRTGEGMKTFVVYPIAKLVQPDPTMGLAPGWTVPAGMVSAEGTR
jgi:hypothetical protein